MGAALCPTKFLAKTVNTAAVTQAPPQVAQQARRLNQTTGAGTVKKPLAMAPKTSQDPAFTAAPTSNVGPTPMRSVSNPDVKVIKPMATWAVLMVLDCVPRSNLSLSAVPKVP